MGYNEDDISQQLGDLLVPMTYEEYLSYDISDSVTSVNGMTPIRLGSPPKEIAEFLWNNNLIEIGEH